MMGIRVANGGRVAVAHNKHAPYPRTTIGDEIPVSSTAHSGFSGLRAEMAARLTRGAHHAQTPTGSSLGMTPLLLLCSRASWRVSLVHGVLYGSRKDVAPN